MDPQLHSLILRGAQFYCGHSGGKDSQAMYAHLLKIIPFDQLHVVHADLGDVEWPGVKDHIRATIRHPLLLAKAFHKDGRAATFFSLVERQVQRHLETGKSAPPWPDSGNRFCTSDLKTGPIWRVIRQAGHPLVVNCVGIRGGESGRRSKKVSSRPANQLTLNKKNTNSVREAYDFWPIADWTCRTDRKPRSGVPEVFAEIKAAGQSPHPAYLDGNQRLSCMFCIFGSRGDLRRAAKAAPDLLSRYVSLEKTTGYTMFNGTSLLEKLGGEGKCD